MKEIIKTQILNAIAADQSEILEFTNELVAIATENPPGAFYKACVNAIKNKLYEIGLDYEIVEIPNQDPNLDNNKFPRYCILSFYGEGKKFYIFMVTTMLFLPQVENNSIHMSRVATSLDVAHQI